MKSQSLSAVRIQRPPQTGDMRGHRRTRKAKEDTQVLRCRSKDTDSSNIFFQAQVYDGWKNELGGDSLGLEKGFKNQYLNTEKEGDFLKNKSIQQLK